MFLGFTSNLVSSGIRDTVRYLTQHRMVSYEFYLLLDLFATIFMLENDLFVMKLHRTDESGKLKCFKLRNFCYSNLASRIF